MSKEEENNFDKGVNVIFFLLIFAFGYSVAFAIVISILDLCH